MNLKVEKSFRFKYILMQKLNLKFNSDNKYTFGYHKCAKNSQFENFKMKTESETKKPGVRISTRPGGDVSFTFGPLT